MTDISGTGFDGWIAGHGEVEVGEGVGFLVTQELEKGVGVWVDMDL